MKMQNYVPYLLLTFKRLNFYWYCLLIAVFIVALMVGIIRTKRKKETLSQMIVRVGFFTYLCFIFIGTVFSRTCREPFRISLNALSNFQDCIAGVFSAQVETIANILLFIPFGALLLFVPDKGYSFRTRILLTLLSGILCTVLIELIQFVSGWGLFETADILSNTLGNLIGLILGNGIWIILKRKNDKKRMTL